MPITPTYPGVYIEEIPSGVRTIVGVATSITVFIGRALRGPTDEAVRIQGFTDFERSYGGLWIKSPLGYMVQQYFLNGGTDAIIVRSVKNAEKGKATVGGLALEAANPGEWSTKLKATTTIATKDDDPAQFNLEIFQQPDDPDEDPVKVETFLNLSTDPLSPRFAPQVLEQGSSFVRVDGDPPANVTEANRVAFAGGTDGEEPGYDPEYTNSLDLLDKVDLFNLLCIAPRNRDENVADDNGGKALLSAALAYCKKRRAMLIVDPPSSWTNVRNAQTDAENPEGFLGPYRDENAIVYFPQVIVSDVLKENRLAAFPPSGVMAGVMARTDAQRGVWKAPAGIDTTLSGVAKLSYKMTDLENGLLNPLGINCLRSFPVYGTVAWGARTLEGADRLASEWKYIPVRRLTLFLQESLYRGTQWVVFEPNDEPLWSQIRLNIGAFMNNLFKQGAFQGKTPRDAYLVKCDSETTTQNDINQGIVNIIVGFAPLKPAEFVIIKFQQLAGQIAT
ncbi:MAG: phage tail sheath subtilisin-like domain-containing protein [Elainellaceae cyanobacterium]